MVDTYKRVLMDYGEYINYKDMETGTIILVVWFIGIIGFTYMMVKMGNTIGDNNEADWDLDENN